MWSLLNPLFLWGVAAAVVPLLLHLLQRRRTVRVRFSTIRFLRLAQKRSANRVRLENLLLWLLRTLLMILIALAFAMPIVRTQAFGKFFGSARRDVAIVWDVSYSLGYESGRKQVWEETRDAAVAVVEALQQGDRVCIYLATDGVIPLLEQPTSDLGLALSLIKAQEPRTAGSSLVPAVQAAWDTLKAASQRERELYIITDGQALAWDEFRETVDAAAPATTDERAEGGPPPAVPVEGNGSGNNPPRGTWNPKSIDSSLAVFVALLGAEAPQNTAPLQVEVQPGLLLSDAPATVAVKLGHTGPPQETVATLVVDEQEEGRRTAFLAEDRGEDVLFHLPGLPAGLHAARVETPADGLAIDNAFHFLLRVREKLPILCVGAPTDTFFLERALNPTGQSATIQIRRIDPAGLTRESLSDALCVFLVNALPLPGQAIQELERYVRQGGLLVVFPGDRATMADYEPWACLPARPQGVEEDGGEARRVTIRLTKPQDPIFASMKLPPGTVPMVGLRRWMRWGELQEGAEVVLAAASEQPFLLARNFGGGRVLAFSVSADRRWSDLPLSPFYLPFVHQIVQFGAGTSQEQLFVWANRPVDLTALADNLPDGTELAAPSQQTQPVRRIKTDGSVRLQVENITEPGIYRQAGRGGAPGSPVLAVNVPRREADLRPIKAAEVPGLIGLKNVNVARDRSDLLRQMEEYRVGRPLAEGLFWVALIVAMLELFIANRQSRAARTLSADLGIDLAGRIRGKRPHPPQPAREPSSAPVAAG